MSQALRFEAGGIFAVAPEALWPLVADTPRLNRALGLPPVEYTITPVAGGGSHIEAQVRMLGIPMARWTEHPFRWEAPRGFTVIREYHGGPIERFLLDVQLAPNDGGCEVRVAMEIRPRNALGALLARRVIGAPGVRKIVDQHRIFERYLLGELPDPFPQLAGRRDLPTGASEASARLESDDLDPRASERLRRHLAEAADEDVVSMRPFELADRWGLDRRQTLTLFLRATTAGLLTMSWDVLCPNCRVGKAEYFSLRDLAPRAHCESCNIAFDASFDRLVEVRFTVAPAIRRVERREFCIGGPMNTPHILAQTSIPPRGTERLTPSLAPGSYRVRATPSSGQLILSAAEVDGEPAQDTPSRLAVTIDTEVVEPAVADVAAGPLSLDLTNRTDQERRVVLERLAWPDTIVTAAAVSAMQEFRDLFSSEALAPGLQLSIETLAFMFTDLSGSTALYETLGQARAFRLVQDHFVVLGSAIATNGGAMIKTIGDAVMAVFPTGEEALAAALQIQFKMRAMPAPDGVDPARLVKIGLHQGPCVAVNLNSRLDYFGTTVNTAARIEHECLGGQIVASLAVCRSDAAAQLLRESGATLQEDVVRLRGLDEPVAIYRVVPPPQPSRMATAGDRDPAATQRAATP